MADKPRCDKCRFAAPSREGDKYRECRKHAPQTLAGSRGERERTWGWFGVMRDNEWCGEYEPENPQTVPEAAATIARLVLLGDLTAAYVLIDKLQEHRSEAQT